MDPLFKKHIIPGRGEKLADHGAKYDTWKVNVQIQKGNEDFFICTQKGDFNGLYPTAFNLGFFNWPVRKVKIGVMQQPHINQNV